MYPATNSVPRRRAPRALAGALCLLPALAGPALADPAVRYWSTWQVDDGEWAEPAEAPRAAFPGEGSTIGLRYGLVRQGADAGRPPRALPDVATTCAEADPVPGLKRVQVVVDYGRPGESVTPRDTSRPEAEVVCAHVPEVFSTEQVFRAVLDLSEGTEGICSVHGHPEDGCSSNWEHDADPAVLEAREDPVEAELLTPEQALEAPELPENTTPGAAESAAGEEDEGGVTEESAGTAPPTEESSTSSAAGAADPGSTESPTSPADDAGESDDGPADPVRVRPLLPWWAVTGLLLALGAGLWALLRPLPPRTARKRRVASSRDDSADELRNEPRPPRTGA
ncbi:hypothetical protein SAMN05445756_0351 [Kytococcus aerolatus]|uniref:MYXO-CTERM domain-containing protein n=1 Tax=Kytococcus aerolatus TaxID=592308 RepID=A0A212T422_9MICO|nr:SCO2322 family protein [Kytococcus aerolatus]SNC60793.1 hypothetical protein SAMN05445756_0351 [Kytococcus aerolatus]